MEDTNGMSLGGMFYRVIIREPFFEQAYTAIPLW